VVERWYGLEFSREEFGMSRGKKVEETVGAELRRGRVAWLSAMRWRRAVEGELSEIGLTFTQWLVLEATHELSEESGEAVNQSEVARRLELDRMTVSQVMRTLERQGLVDRGPAMAPPALRIWATDAGRRAISKARARANSASSAFAKAARP
jgi:DNA-binding MarR family transcriptional regulator